MSSNTLNITIEQVAFSAEKITKPTCVWISSHQPMAGIEETHSIGKFFENLAHIVKPNDFFEHINTDQQTQVEMYAEQYGGHGVGANGGGARCGNINGYQLKGVGVTPVVGNQDNLYVTSGIYPLYEAVTEAANYEIYSKILPIGLVDFYSVLHIGETPYFVTAENSTEKQIGITMLAIGVREIACRVGHFLRAGHFLALPEHKLRLKSDVARVRINNQNLHKALSSEKQFIQLLGDFLSNCAIQFAFARVSRIAHGALTPSNIAIDGRWLDLTNTTFVPSGYHYRAGMGDPPSLVEKDTVIKFTSELMFTYCKYNNVELDIGPLENYYYEQLSACYHYYIVELLGLDAEAVAALNLTSERELLSRHYDQVLECGTILLKGVPRHEWEDGAVVDFVEGLFNVVSDREHNCQIIDSELAKSVERLFRQTYLSKKTKHTDFNAFVIESAIKAFRKVYLMPFFFIGRVYIHSREVVAEGVEEISGYIEDFGNTTNWVFGKEDLPQNVIIFDSLNLSVHYFSDCKKFGVKKKSENKIYYFTCVESLITELGSVQRKDFIVTKFNFYPHILRLLKYLKTNFRI